MLKIKTVVCASVSHAEEMQHFLKKMASTLKQYQAFEIKRTDILNKYERHNKSTLCL